MAQQKIRSFTIGTNGDIVLSNYEENQQNTKKGKKNTDLPIPPRASVSIQGINGNPFKFDPNLTNYESVTIEDYNISYKGKNVTLGEFIRNSSIRFPKKKKIIRNTFAKWDKDFKSSKQESVKYTNETFAITGEFRFAYVSVVAFIILIVLLALLSVVTVIAAFAPNILEQFAFVMPLITKMNTALQSDLQMQIFGYGSLGLVAFTLIYIISYNLTSYSYKSFLKQYEGNLKRKDSLVDKNYKQRYKKVLNYYMKKLNKKGKPFSALTIKEVQPKYNLNTITSVQESFHKKAIKRKKNAKRLKFWKGFLYFLVFCFNGYLLYLIVILMLS